MEVFIRSEFAQGCPTCLFLGGMERAGQLLPHCVFEDLAWVQVGRLFSPASGKCGFYVCRKKNQSHLSRIEKLDLKVPLDVKSDLLKKGSSR